MQAIIFEEFRAFVAAALPPDAAEAMEGDGTSGGTSRSHEALLAGVRAIAERTGLSTDEVQRRFGMHLFRRFAALYPVFFVGVESALGLLGRLDGYVHAEVQKLYPEARFPTFASRPATRGGLEMTYRSRRPFAALAEGLISGCVAHFGDRLEVRRVETSPDGTEARFEVVPAARSRDARRR